MINNENYEKIKNNFLKEQIFVMSQVLTTIDKAASKEELRAYGGVIRATKGTLLEDFLERLINNVWKNLGGDINRLDINSKKVKVKINESFIINIENDYIKNKIFNDIDKYFYNCSVDKHVFIDNKFIFAIESKNYTENAMLKRVLIDFWFIKHRFPLIETFLVQFESQLGGDYSELKSKDLTIGSYSSNSIMSYFPSVNLKIRTLMPGERRVDKPIHKFQKGVSYEKCSELYDEFALILIKFI